MRGWLSILAPGVARGALSSSGSLADAGGRLALPACSISPPRQPRQPRQPRRGGLLLVPVISTSRAGLPGQTAAWAIPPRPMYPEWRRTDERGSRRRWGRLLASEVAGLWPAGQSRALAATGNVAVIRGAKGDGWHACWTHRSQPYPAGLLGRSWLEWGDQVDGAQALGSGWGASGVPRPSLTSTE